MQLADLQLSDYITVPEAAAALGKSESQVRWLLRNTEPPMLTGVKVKRDWLVLRASVERLANEYAEGMHKPGPAQDELSPTRREMKRRAERKEGRG